MRLPLNKFTLIGATTKLESLSAPLKNRFIYKFHFQDYTQQEINAIVQKYLQQYDISSDTFIIEKVATKIEHTPREIHNICVKIRDYLIAQDMIDLAIYEKDRAVFEQRLNIDE
jgi:holliday junction DNA helicase RuvB